AIFGGVIAQRVVMPALLDDFANGRASALQVVERLAGQAEMLSRVEMPADVIGELEPAPQPLVAEQPEGLSDEVVDESPIIEPVEELQPQDEAELDRKSGV